MTDQTVPDSAGILRAAARDKDLGFHVTASWADVQRKAKRIRAEGGVTIVVASNDGIGGQVKGDKHTYEAILVFRPGTHKVADWTCGCAWAAYAFDRSPMFKRFEGRKCSHALALQFEAQSQGMFGKEVHPSELPKKVRTVVKYDPDNGQSVFARPYEGSLAAVAVARLRAQEADPAEVIGQLIQTGMKHTAARDLWKAAHSEEEHRCPHCGSFIGPQAIEHGKCPHCGGPLAGGHHHEHEAKLASGYWHGTDHDLDDQGYLLPPAKSGQVPNHHDDEADRDRVFMTDSPEGARQWGQHVYEVSPHHEPDEDDDHVYSTDGPVRIVRKHEGAAHEGALQIGLDLVDADQLGPVLMGKEEARDARHLGIGAFIISGSKEPSAQGPTVSGIALKAHDTGRVLMLQRGLDDEKDPARGLWEMPGGHHEDGDLTSLHAGIREFQEEVGQPFPDNGVVKHTWTSPNGVYQGHVVVIPRESDLSMKDGRVVPNPDDPHGDHHEQAAWWSVEHAKKNPALRPEVKAHTPWREIEKASLDTAKTASGGLTPGQRHALDKLQEYPEHIAGAPYHQLMSEHGFVLHAPGDGPHEYEEQTEVPDEDTTRIHPDLPLHTNQDFMKRSTLEHYVRNPYTHHASDYDPERGRDERVHVYSHGGQHWISDGHHRVLADRMSDRAGITAGHYDVDAERQAMDDWVNGRHQASSWDPISNTTVTQPGRNLSEPQHSTSKNPVSTGFATSEDPSNWDNVDVGPISGGVTPAMSFDSTLHDRPEPALPSTDGMAEYHPEISQEDLDPIPDNPALPDPYQPQSGIVMDEDGTATPNTYHSSLGGERSLAEIVADFQKSAGAQALMVPEQAQEDTDDIAAAARAHLNKTALADFSPEEQRELINENPDARARNFDGLKLEGSHYALLEEAMANGEVDPSGLFL